MKFFAPLLLLFLLPACKGVTEAPLPNLAWPEFDAPDNKPLAPQLRSRLEGIYTLGDAADDFGKEAVLKWSWLINGKDTTHYFSFFCSEDVRYFICQGKQKDSLILLNGYWRNVENAKVGKVHLSITAPGVKALMAASPDSSRLPVQITGVYGLFDEEPTKKISFQHLRSLKPQPPFLIIAHRGGGRNSDLLPASENSVEMIELASRLGANGMEIDVQLTADGVPVLYHDAQINDRLTKMFGVGKAIEKYTWPQLQAEVDLKRGGKIPTLRAALETTLYKTAIRYVWLDCKYPKAIPYVRQLQQEFIEKSKAAGSPMTIHIGIPDDKIMQAFMALPDYKNIPSLCELSIDSVRKLNAQVWATSWSKGHQDEEVSTVQKEGRQAFGWTLDVPDKIKEYMRQAKFNGIVTNRPSYVAYAYYSR